MALLTHFHGDHIDFAPLLQERYNSQIITCTENADIILNPSKYNFSCHLNWYGFDINKISITKTIDYEETFYWNDIAITPIALPIHSQGHCGFILNLNDERVAITGDTIQSRGDDAPIFEVIPSNGETRNNFKAFKRLLNENITLNCGGHGSHFRQCQKTYEEAFARVSNSQKLFDNLFDDK